MCGIKSRSLLVLLVGFLLLLPVYSWAKGSAEESNVEPTEKKPESLYEATESEWNLVLNETEKLSTESVRLKTLAQTLEAQLTELSKEADGLKHLLNESGQQLEISLNEVKRLETILNKKVPIIAVSTGIGIFLIGGLIGGLIHSTIPVVK